MSTSEDGGGDGGPEGTGLAGAGDEHGAAGDVGVDLHEHGIFIGDAAGAHDAFDGNAVSAEPFDYGASAEGGGLPMRAR